MAAITQWKLRRLAPRAKRVLSRRKESSAAIAAYEPTLVPKADEYISAYDKAAKYRSTWKKEMEEGRGAAAELLKAIQRWLPLLTRDIPTFDATEFGDKPNVPDDLIGDADRMCDLVTDHLDNQGKPLAFQAALIGEIEPALQKAQKECSEAEAADSEFQGLLQAVREKAEALNAEMRAFRMTLGAVVGRRDKDFQKLRANRAGSKDDEDDPTAPEPPAPVKPAPAGQKEPA